MRIHELQQKKAAAVAAARAISTEANARTDSKLSADEEQRFNGFMNEALDLGKEIDREARLIEQEKSLAEQHSRANPADKGEKEKGDKRVRPQGTEPYHRAFQALLNVADARNGGLADEHRALLVSTDTEGGFTAASEQFVTDLIKNVDDMVWIRQVATKHRVATAKSLGVPTLENDPADADWTTEIGTISADTAMSFGKRKLQPHPLSKLLKVSRDFLRQSLVGGEALVRNRLAYKIALPQEKAMLTGHGVGQPLGVFTASADGIPTSRDVTATATQAFTFPLLQAVKYGLKAQYRNSPSIRWLFSRTAILKIAQLVDGQNKPLWQESIRIGEPATLLGYPVMESEHVPATFTSGLYVGLLGDFSHYWVADAYDVEIQRVDELYAETNQVGFMARAATDGAPVLAEAFVRAKVD